MAVRKIDGIDDAPALGDAILLKVDVGGGDARAKMDGRIEAKCLLDGAIKRLELRQFGNGRAQVVGLAGCRLDPGAEGVPIVRETVANAGLERAMSNSFGFGGTNAVLVFQRSQA